MSAAICALLLLLASLPLLSQETPRSSLAKVKESASSKAIYNLKAGELLLGFSSGLSVEFNDNINLSNSSPEPDLILTPSLTINASWALSKINTLELDTKLSYRKHLFHSQYDQTFLQIDPGSQLAFNIFVGDFKFRFYDSFSIDENPSTEGTLSNVAQFGRISNTSGVSVLWDLNDVKLSLGYDYTSFLATTATRSDGSATGNLDALNRNTHRLFAFSLLNLTSTCSTGLEANATTSSYPDGTQSNDRSFGIGPFLSLQLTNYTRFELAAGYQNFDSPNNGSNAAVPQLVDPFGNNLLDLSRRTNQPGGSDSYYGTLAITHRLNRHYQDTLKLGHETESGVIAQRSTRTYLEYASSWQLNSLSALESQLTYEKIKESGQLSAPPYQRFISSFKLRTIWTRKISTALTYEFLRKDSNDPALNYNQNRVVFEVNYQF